MDEEQESEGKKIDLMEALLIGELAVFVDIIDLVPFLSDFSDLIAGPLFQYYIYIKGYGGTSMLVCNGLKLIPFIGELPLRTAAWTATVIIENNKVLKAGALIAEKVTSVTNKVPGAPGGATTTSGTPAQGETTQGPQATTATGAPAKGETTTTGAKPERPSEKAAVEQGGRRPSETETGKRPSGIETGRPSESPAGEEAGKEKSETEERKKELALGAPEEAGEQAMRETGLTGELPKPTLGTAPQREEENKKVIDIQKAKQVQEAKKQSENQNDQSKKKAA